MDEATFEQKLVELLSTGRVSVSNYISEDSQEYHIGGIKRWEYLPHVKTTQALWDNFKTILEQLNPQLQKPLTDTEFAQVKREIIQLQTPYDAGVFLYGMNGICQVSVTLDDGETAVLKVFDQREIGAGDTRYQVVTQIHRPAVVQGKLDRRFDTTLLINGLPIIQIEEKTATHNVNEALNQMNQYIAEKQFSDIFSTIQILVAMTPDNVKYMANTTADKFNTDFAFHWQSEEDNTPVRRWHEFTNQFLTIPMAHQMACTYMVLDSTKNKQCLKVLRPYQVYAIQKIINKLKTTDFTFGQNKIGYIWHTTGSGKTITSFKTAWLASRLPNVDKVIFVVDRIDLTTQTSDEYNAYNPDEKEYINDTKNRWDLKRQLTEKSNGIIITSVQKLNLLIKDGNYLPPKRNFVFVVDEAHRSTGGESFEDIQKVFKHAAFIGYTGTPMFDDTTKGKRTEDIFGPLLHAYTIREAIADRNVLGFKVDFQTTIPEDVMKSDFLPAFYAQKYPNWSMEKIQQKINNLTPEDMDDSVESSFYDFNDKHVTAVVEDIFKHWKNRSVNGKYNAMLTTHVGGGKASSPMALQYFRKFNEINRTLPVNEQLKVALTYSVTTNNSDNQLENNNGLEEAIKVYNKQFDKSFDMTSVDEYMEDLRNRMQRKVEDGKYLDLLIVVDQMLTGFNAPYLNTLYVDRTLRNASLIQAYSRTNRIVDMQEKPFGRIVNYRWPAYNEKLMNDALSIYADINSANLTDRNVDGSNGIVAKPFKDVLQHVKETVKKLKDISNGFKDVPLSEAKQEEMLELIRSYSRGVTQLKQYEVKEVEGIVEGFDYDNPERLIESLGLSKDDEIRLTKTLKNELIEKLAHLKGVSFEEIDLRMAHIKEVRVNYDYLTELIQALMNAVHDNKQAEVDELTQKIGEFTKALDDRHHAQEIDATIQAIVTKEFPSDKDPYKYPYQVKNYYDVVQRVRAYSQQKMIRDFRTYWGIDEVITSEQLLNELSGHTIGNRTDLNDRNQLDNLLKKSKNYYKEYADDTVKTYSWLTYRSKLTQALYELADKVVK